MDSGIHPPHEPPKTRERPTYDLMARRCDQCLTTPQRIVSGARAAQIIRDCRAGDHKFVCHKAQLGGLENVACRGVHDRAPCFAFRFAQALGIPVRLIDPDTLQVLNPEVSNV